MTTSVDDIVATFDLFSDWEDKYRFILDLGKNLPDLPEEQKVEANLVRGCQSQVWILVSRSAGKLTIRLDSDAFIVRGLIAILLSAIAGLNAREIVNYDFDALFAKLDLLAHLSPTRGNGLNAMIMRVRQAARD